MIDKDTSATMDKSRIDEMLPRIMRMQRGRDRDEDGTE
jgi:hypothetical protein